MAPRRAATQALTQSLQDDDGAHATRRHTRKASAGSKTAPTPSRDIVATSPAAQYFTTGLQYSFTSVTHFLITAVATLVLQTAFSALVQQYTGKTLASVSRHFTSTWTVLGLTAWKVLELGVGWFAGYGNVAIAPFIALLRLPHMYLLNAFYEVPFFPLFLELVSHILAAFLAFSVYRRPATFRPVQDSAVIDRKMRGYFTFQIISALFSTALYAFIILASVYSWLPVHLAVHWDGLKTLEKAHEATVLSMFQHLIGMGWCTMYLLLDFVPTTSDEHSSGKTTDAQPFDPVSASLTETLAYNINSLLFWRNAKVAGRALLKHTAFLAVCLTVDAAFQSCATIEGCETFGLNWIYGPLPWGALWGAGVAASGVALGWVAGVL